MGEKRELCLPAYFLTCFYMAEVLFLLCYLGTIEANPQNQIQGNKIFGVRE